jgi:hypothetical protein
MPRRLVTAAGAFVGGAVATYAVVLVGTVTAWDLLGIVDRDGGGTMGLAFVIGPTIAMLGGIAAAVVAMLRARQPHAPEPGAPPAGGRGGSRFAVLAGALAGGLTGHVLTRIVLWLAAPTTYDALWQASVHAWSPTVMTCAGAIAGAALGRRWRAAA